MKPRTHLSDVDLIELERVGRSTLERVPSAFGRLQRMLGDLVLVAEHRDGDVGISASTGDGSCLGRHRVVCF